MKYYLILQGKRMVREMRAFGVLPSVGIVLCSLGFVLFSLFLFKKLPVYGAYLYPFIPVSGCILLAEKQRHDFLGSIFSKRSLWSVRMIENAIIALPFSIFLLFRNDWIIALSTLAMCVATAYLKTEIPFSYRIPSPFSRFPYEFTTGFRRNYVLIVGAYILSVFALISHNFNLGIVTLYGLALIAATFYSQLDPIFFVWIFSFTTKEFLYRKAKTGLFYGLSLLAPVFVPIAIVYPTRILVTLAALIFAILTIILAIFSAYANFPGRLTAIQKLKFAVALIFPFALLYVVPNFYLGALEKVKQYLKC